MVACAAFPHHLYCLVKFHVANMMSVEHLKFTEVLLARPFHVHSEQEVLAALKLDVKTLRVIANYLKAEKIIRIASRQLISNRQHNGQDVHNIGDIEASNDRSITSPKAQNQTKRTQYTPIETSPAISLLKTNIYWLDFVGVVNATRYKLDVIHTQILQQEKQVLGNPLFKCSKCQKTYSDLDIVNIFDKTLNVFKCTICFNILDEWDAKSPENETTQQDNQIEDQRFAAQISLTQLFNGQMQQLYDWLKLCDEQSIYTTLNKIGKAEFKDVISRNLSFDELASLEALGQNDELTSKILLSHKHSRHITGQAFAENEDDNEASMRDSQLLMSVNLDDIGNESSAYHDKESKPVKDYPEWLRHTVLTSTDASNSEFDRRNRSNSNSIKIPGKEPDLKIDRLQEIADLLPKEKLDYGNISIDDYRSKSDVKNNQSTSLLLNKNNFEDRDDDNEDSRSQVTINIDGIDYPLDDIPEEIMMNLSDEKQQEYLRLCEDNY